MRRSAVQLLVWALVLLAVPSANAQLSACYAGFDISQACISQRGLNPKVAEYQRKITEVMLSLGASYNVKLRPVNNPIEVGYSTNAIADVFTEIVPNEEMRNESFIINVTADFLENQSELLFEASSLHEICHIMNDDLTGYHRNGANVEVAEEHCVLQAVGEERYEQYLKAYANYKHWDSSTYDGFLLKVKELALVPPQREIDDADRCVADYFRKHPGSYDQLLVFNGELHVTSLNFTQDRVQLGLEKLKAIIKTGKPLVFFHNHPAERGREATFPSHDDFGVAALISFMVYMEKPDVPVEFRVMQTGKVSTSVSYGFKTTAIEDIKKVALEYRKAVALKGDLAQIEMKRDLLDYQLAQDSFNDYLQHVFLVDHAGKHPEPCMTVPQYFIWPSERFFIYDRPQ